MQTKVNLGKLNISPYILKWLILLYTNEQTDFEKKKIYKNDQLVNKLSKKK